MKKLLITCILSSVLFSLYTQNVKKVVRDDNYWGQVANYEENKIPPYTLPDPLICNDGERITNIAQWENIRRPELLQLLTTYMYGKTPALTHALPWKVDTIDTKALGGKAVRKVIELQLTNQKNGPVMHLQIWLPKVVKQSIPLFLGMSFTPNWKISTAPEWPIRKLLAHGYGLATFLYTEISPDGKGTSDYSKGIMPWYYRKGQTQPDPDQWGDIAVWAWAASRAMDYLQTDAQIDGNRVALIGHSRLGKATLWAGACDERFKVVFPVNSGCCGVSLSKRLIGETPTSVNHMFPAWFNGNFKQFSDREDMMPFDQHSVIALIAPRPIYIADAEADNWGDQKGEFLAAKAAEPVYALYGKAGIGTNTMPPLDIAYNKGYIAYHIRKGPHAVLEYDWYQFIRFADRFLKTGSD